MAEKKRYIIVARQEGVLQSWARDASSFALSIGLIGVGVWLDSSAMQWLGAVFAFITIYVKAIQFMNKYTYDMDGAQKALDAIRDETAP